MVDPHSTYSRQQKYYRLAWIGCVGALMAPLLVFAACAGLRLEVWSLTTALDLITLKIAWPLSWLGAATALMSVWAARGAGRGGWIPAVLAVVVAIVTIGVFVLHFQRAGAATSSPDVVSNADDPPGYSAAVLARREEAGAVPSNRWSIDRGTCAGAIPTPRQVAPGVAGFALKKAGFDVSSMGVSRADGAYTGFWFGRTWDAVVRIRPERTDVRVTARDNRRGDEGQACRLATSIADTLQLSE